jgi:hypothetical protein
MLSIVRYLNETWSATPIQPPVGSVSSGYQNIIDRNLKTGNGQFLLLRKNKDDKSIRISYAPKK